MIRDGVDTVETILTSLVDQVDLFYIHDTGSVDGTPDFIANFCEEHGVEFALERHDWKNYGHNRELMLRTCASSGVVSDYLGTDEFFILMLDADDYLEVNDPNWKNQLDPAYDIYDMDFVLGNLTYQKPNLFNAKSLIDKTWSYHMPVHEYFGFDGYDICNRGFIKGVRKIGIQKTDGQGASRFENYIKLLTEYLGEIRKRGSDKTDLARTYFYLAESHKDLSRYIEDEDTCNNLRDKAIQYYTDCIFNTSFIEESYMAHLNIVRLERDPVQIFMFIKMGISVISDRPELHFEMLMFFNNILKREKTDFRRYRDYKELRSVVVESILSLIEIINNDKINNYILFREDVDLNRLFGLAIDTSIILYYGINKKGNPLSLGDQQGDFKHKQATGANMGPYWFSIINGELLKLYHSQVNYSNESILKTLEDNDKFKFEI